jgi:hypothetical protein
MSVAIADAFRYVATSGTNAGEVDGTITAPGVGGTLTIVGGFGITLTSDTANRKITITNTGNGTGALTTITAQNSAGTYYPVFTTAPGTFNPATGTYTSSTLYYESTTTPLSYNPGTGTLNVNNLVLGAAGTFSLDGITSTGVTGTGNVVFGTSPTLTSPTILTSALFGPSASANLTRFTNAQVVVSSISAGIQQNEVGNIGLIAEAVGINTVGRNAGLYGVGYTSGAYPAGGVIGEAHVSATGDATSAVGVRGYAQDTHAGGMNIGLYGNASGSSIGNYALYMGGGDIYNNGGAQTWTMTGNLTFSGAYTTTIPTLNLTNALGVSYGGTGTGTASITAFNNITGYTASGATGTTSTNLVFSTSPSLTTPSLGVASATSINKMAITAPATSSTLAVADGKTFTVSNTITLAGTDSTTITLPSTTGTVPLNNQTMYVGTTSFAINRVSSEQALTGITGFASSNATAAASTAVSITSGTTTTSGTTGNVTLSSGTSAGVSGNLNLNTGTGTTSGNIAIDVGVGSGTNGTISIGTSNATTVTVPSGKTKLGNTTLTQGGSVTITFPTLAGTLIGTGDTGTVSNTMLASSSVTFGSTAVSLGGSSTTLAGLTSIDGTTGLTSVFATPNGTVALLGAATTLNIGASATALTLGYTSTASSTSNIATGATASGNTKAINIGTNGASGSTTTITIGSANGTTTTVYGLSLSGQVGLPMVIEIVTPLTGATGTVVHDTSSTNTFVHTSISANFTANFTNVPTTDNRSITFQLVLVQGASAFVPNAVQIGGSAQTINWAGNAVPVGTPNRIDVVIFQLIKSSGVTRLIGSLGSY